MADSSPSILAVFIALPKEQAALLAAFGLPHDPSRIFVRNGRRYDSIILACFDGSYHQLILPEPSMAGNNRAAIPGPNLLNDFPEVQDVVLVGIAGAVPYLSKPEEHVRLGDVVLLGDQGVIQFDIGVAEAVKGDIAALVLGAARMQRRNGLSA